MEIASSRQALRPGAPRNDGIIRTDQLSLLALALSVLLCACTANAPGERYRGEYTFGHEVNVFCPEINSQCYWLGPNSGQAARERLKAIYRDKKPGLYKPVCVVIDGVIDRESPRDGFAADYDGLIDISAVHGDCDGGAAIAPGDLNHRRWVLAEHNDIAIDAKADPVVLDFGERLFVEITDGCRRFSGFARLGANRIVFDRLERDLSACAGSEPPARVFPGQNPWQVVLGGRDGLELSADGTRLAFRRDDWR